MGGGLLRPPARSRFRRRAEGGGPAQHDLPLALLTFNLGVEAGQLVFVGTILLALAALRPLARKWAAASTGARAEAHLRLGTGNAIGILSSAWLIERLLEFS
jgi:hypothetical protein